MKKGMSLIVLVITILVMIILAGVVVVGLSNNNPIEQAQSAKVLSDLSNARSQGSLYASNKLKDAAIAAGGVTDPKLVASGAGAELSGTPAAALKKASDDSSLTISADENSYYKISDDGYKAMGITKTSAASGEYYCDVNGNIVLVFATQAAAKAYKSNAYVFYLG